ncbi:MAG: hypothetical protein KAY37_07785 [Phycisphaerae bacterium]|nr:hypothetical protein [Phycisphaerae bacterium]
MPILDIILGLGILAISLICGYFASTHGASPVESVFVGLAFAILGYLLELRYLKIGDLSGRTLMDRYRSIEGRILNALKLALDSKALSTALHNSIVRPTVEHFVQTGVLENDKYAEELLVKRCELFGRSIGQAATKGLPVPNYLNALWDLTNRSQLIRATSLLPWSLFLKDDRLLKYVEYQNKLLASGDLTQCVRIFIIENRFDDKAACHQVAKRHGAIQLRKFVPSETNKEVLLDFVIFDDKCVLVSESLQQLLLQNQLDSIEEMEQRWRTIEPFVGGQYLFSKPTVQDYVEKFLALERSAEELILEAGTAGNGK